MLDIERILQTKIPDIAPVYGGVRGRTISSHKQAYAWKTIVAAGLKQVIDLRKDYSADRYPDLCRQYGVDYFHYPIDNDHETIVKMAEFFPVFCEKIDQGDFYIACAMGLHRTDIARIAVEPEGALAIDSVLCLGDEIGGVFVGICEQGVELRSALGADGGIDGLTERMEEAVEIPHDEVVGETACRLIAHRPSPTIQGGIADVIE